TLIVNGENVGFSAGNNIGLDYVLGAGLACDSVLFLNNDCVVKPNCIRRLVHASSNGSAVAYAFQVDETGVERFAIQKSSFPKLIYLLSPFVGWSHEYSAKEDVIEVDWVGGAALLLNMRVVETLLRQDGYVWRPDYFLYCEDDELSFRLRKKGVKMMVPLDAVVEHRSHSFGSKRRLYYTIRNRFHLIRDHFGVVGRWVCIPLVGFISLTAVVKTMIKGNHSDARLRILAITDGVMGRRGRKEHFSMSE
ncbi:MAG TPA: glycosyltransferase family 2 protein, partial [Chromatiaceae bacterium]|nr:glycosyltransferase family 2 protein [Chromatiaceae bacterium]